MPISNLNLIKKFLDFFYKAMDEFYEKDAPTLLDREGMERTCVARIFYYLQKNIDLDGDFRELNLDCEYNKNGDDPKYLDSTSKEKSYKVPDMILHKRGVNNSNKVIFEFKCKGTQQNKIVGDYKKLKAFVLSKIFHYEVGIFVFIGNVKENTKIVFFVEKEDVGNLKESVAQSYQCHIYSVQVCEL